MLVPRRGSPRDALAAAVILASLVVAAGCARQPAPVPVTQFQPLADAYFPVKFEHPAGWHVVSEGTRVMVYSSPEAIQRFHDPAAKTPWESSSSPATRRMRPLSRWPAPSPRFPRK